jgi:hypothetical protein
MNNKKTYKVSTTKNTTTLTDKDYLAVGGQAMVFAKKKQGLAYKIYHDPKQMIPVAKIQELAELKHDNILAPIEPLYDTVTRVPVGFTMRYVQGIEFLCKIFTRTFRDEKNISPMEIVGLVTQKQNTLRYIHTQSNHTILGVDLNEMNFLLDKDIKNVYFIDVDNYQTKNFPCVAIMESIRDRTTKRGEFSELTDWFSWAVVTFQMYIGMHPYKGFCKGFKPAEWSKRMDQGVSCFHPDASLPTTCQDFSVIPKKHRDWYEAVFQHGERSIPPFADGVVIAAAIVRTIGSKGDFVVRELLETPEPIMNVYVSNGKRFIVTSGGVYDNQKKKVVTFQKPYKRAQKGLCDVFGEDPLFVYLKDLKAKFYELNGTEVSSIKAEDIMGSNGAIYTINNGQLIENTFERFGKLQHRTKMVCDISMSYKVFKGVVIQDDFMKCRLAIPFEIGKCINVNIEELDGQRIVDARYEKGICVVLAEKQGKYFRYILCFNDAHSDYSILTEDVIDFHLVNFTVLPNKMCLLIDDEKLSMFKNNKGRKEITNLPFDVSMRLYHDNMQVLFVDDRKLYSVTMK